MVPAAVHKIFELTNQYSVLANSQGFATEKLKVKALNLRLIYTCFIIRGYYNYIYKVHF